ncbi:molybdate ABC transporter substrate-binding protein [Jiella marina]|uniref:molybdate ABC transporter substrate-binding protein n=1 Tax=Jiella sp. LLJ827 TaxID=2917712 RepID=UPI00210185D1|nr:molybdate ABC transporter substrate-binding protein [Jiella sp. LLJ827]MCQ0987262.1 molybdate ABC transporter substrate-binding protein [Jiella sp. LLJ827]
MLKLHRLAAATAASAVFFAVTVAEGAETHVAVAANFTEAAKEIAEAFSAKTGDTALLSFGSTGQLYTQISQGAPFDVFLAADTERPERAVAEGHAVEDTRFTYAIGRIVLWSREPSLIQGEMTLEAEEFDRLAIANPATAPYGAAAVETMTALGVHDDLTPKTVQGNNIAQTFQFVETGNAELGFVALSQLTGRGDGSRWVVPADLYTPIRQDAVLLKQGEDDPAASAFLDFLKGPEARSIIARYGYDTEGAE